jgi:hypothetical protein
MAADSELCGPRAFYGQARVDERFLQKRHVFTQNTVANDGIVNRINVIDKPCASSIFIPGLDSYFGINQVSNRRSRSA